MDSMPQCGGDCPTCTAQLSDALCEMWFARHYALKFHREITSVDGSQITINMPIVEAVTDEYGPGSIYKYEYPGRITKCAVRDLNFIAESSGGPEDETHAWSAVFFDEISHAFAENINCQRFGKRLASSTALRLCDGVLSIAGGGLIRNLRCLQATPASSCDGTHSMSR